MTEETRLRLALGQALHHVLQLSHGDDLARDEANIGAIRSILSNALKDRPNPVHPQMNQISTWLILLVHGLCFAGVFLGLLIRG